jgi:aspartyl-tRNA(Asn)/glutamyl-tRNA(Gln) amidotransferase subunit A
MRSYRPAAASCRELDKIGEDEITPHLVEFLRRDWTAEEFADALMVRKAVNNKMRRLMRDYDLLLTPTLAVPPFEVGNEGPTVIDGREVEPFEWLQFTYPLNFTRRPAAMALWATEPLNSRPAPAPDRPAATSTSQRAGW